MTFRGLRVVAVSDDLVTVDVSVDQAFEVHDKTDAGYLFSAVQVGDQEATGLENDPKPVTIGRIVRRYEFTGPTRPTRRSYPTMGGLFGGDRPGFYARLPAYVYEPGATVEITITLPGTRCDY